MKPLKHIVAVIAALVLAGCATTKPVEEPNYALLALTDLGIVADAVIDIDRFLYLHLAYTLELSHNFRSQFPVEEVIKQTTEFDEYLRQHIQENDDMLNAYYAYIRYQNRALKDGATAAELDLLCQMLAELKKQAEIVLSQREQSLVTFSELADKYHFQP
jgi:hypothetical protein